MCSSDLNRDGLVNGTDQIIARNNRTNPLTMLRLIRPPGEQAESAKRQIEASSIDFDWIEEFEQMASKRQRAKRSAIEAAVDRLLAIEAI